jgi:hypothetical protein
LVLVPCLSGAYQGSSAIYVLKRGGQAEPAPFDFAPPGIDPGHPVPTLAEAEWDEGEGSLNSHAKGRGLGDCGVNQSWVWDGTRFRMTFANGLDACRLSGSWLTRYRAQVVWR